MKLTQTFSLLMVKAKKKEVAFHVREIDVDQAGELLDEFGVESYIGTRGFANILSEMLDMDIPHHWARVTLYPGEQGIVAIYDGQTKLTPDHYELPEEAEVRFFHYQLRDQITAVLPMPEMNNVALEAGEVEEVEDGDELTTIASRHD
jgi:hypothetical protein|tara:strand:+ start:7439 stop:7882 length:444 start_codon:yes stop_codon:yes gene_type:complete